MLSLLSAPYTIFTHSQPMSPVQLQQPLPKVYQYVFHWTGTSCKALDIFVDYGGAEQYEQCYEHRIASKYIVNAVHKSSSSESDIR